MISKTILARKNELYRAANEIAALQLLKHRNIISLYQGLILFFRGRLLVMFLVLESKTRVFLVLEYGKGGLKDVVLLYLNVLPGELFDYICAQGKIKDENKARDIFRDILGGLAYMHDEGFHHRDLKPENMLFVNRLHLS